MGRPPLRLICVTNIPSPYRLHEFEYISRELKQRNISLEVIFMTKMEPNRRWQFFREQWTFKNHTAWGFHPRWRNLSFHFNPGIIAYLLRYPPTWLLIGGGWNIPTSTYLAMLSKVLLPKTSLMFWVEATVSSVQYTRRGWKRFIRHTALSPYDAFVVPGECSVAYVRDIVKGNKRNIIQLANVVDEDVYQKKVDELRLKRADLRARLGLGDEVVYLCPARLAPEKGILEFLSAIKNLQRNGFQILLAGDGILHQTIAEFININDMRHVRLLGHQGLQQLLELYALSDILLLPSLREPYGFVAVEAIWAGLPLLISTKVGALPDVLEQGVNGWCFDPFNPDEIRQAFWNCVDSGRIRLTEMGTQSRKIAEQRFATVSAVQYFVDELVSKIPPK